MIGWLTSMWGEEEPSEEYVAWSSLSSRKLTRR